MLLIFYIMELVITKKAISDRTDNYAFISYMANDRDIKGVLTLNYNLTKVGSIYKYYVVIIEKVSEHIRNVLKEHKINIVDIDFFSICKNFTHNIPLIEKVISKHYYGKYLIFSLYQFEKIIYLDTDLLLLENIDHLFQLETVDKNIYMAYDMQLAMSRENEPIIVFTKNGFNSGVIISKPNTILFELCYKLLLGMTIEEFDKINTDQDILNNLVENSAINCIPLNPKYNIPPSVVYDMIAYKFIDKPYIIHYMLKPKPWDVLDAMAYGENKGFYNNVSKHTHKLWISTYMEMMEKHYFTSEQSRDRLYAKEYHYGNFLKDGKGISVDLCPLPKNTPI